MTMKNVKNAHFLQVDNQAPWFVEEMGAIILPSSDAYEEYAWTRKYFIKKPKEGYFVWVKEQIGFPLTTCLTIASPKITQKLVNLVVVESGVKSEMHEACTAASGNLCGVHAGYSKIVLREGASLKIKHFHNWGDKDKVDSGIDFVLEKGAKLSYEYKCMQAPKKLKATNNVFLEKDSSVNLGVMLLAKKSEVDLNESIFLNGNGSRGVSRQKLVGDKKSEIMAKSKMVANAAGTGHLDCTGLLLSNNATVTAIPELVNKNKKASLTHEASVGKIAEENLNYLRSRGLTEGQAIDLIVTGFLGEEELLVAKGEGIFFKQNM